MAGRRPCVAVDRISRHASDVGYLIPQFPLIDGVRVGARRSALAVRASNGEPPHELRTIVEGTDFELPPRLLRPGAVVLVAPGVSCGSKLQSISTNGSSGSRARDSAAITTSTG